MLLHSVRRNGCVWLATLAMLLSAEMVRATPLPTPTLVCSAGSVASILGTTCNIGDKTFSGFSAYGSSGFSLADLTFTPDDSNSLSPGFIISGPLSFTAGSSDAFADLTLTYTVTISDPLSDYMIAGTRVTQSGFDPSWTDFYDNFLSARNVNTASAAVFGCVAGSEINSRVIDSALETESAAVDHALVDPSCLSPTQVTMTSELVLEAKNGTVWIDSAGYYVEQAPKPASQVPEPASLVLLSVGGAGEFLRRRLRSRR